jgi:hypothetical protein
MFEYFEVSLMNVYFLRYKDTEKMLSEPIGSIDIDKNICKKK